MSIHILPTEVASQIAAGEVVERPASVVKELLENSLDAGATTITINVEGAGRRLVEVADDGHGIPASQLSLAVARHATSKLTTAEDLFHIQTLGFRGEALASIGSVARLTLVSRTASASVGARLHVQGGQVGSVEEMGAPVGTLVRVEDLFYNVPARLKFMKREVTEKQHIDALVTRYALAYPNIRLSLIQDGHPVIHTSGAGDRREIMAALYSLEVSKQMIEVIAHEPGVEIFGFVSSISLTRSNRREITFFVNGRPVQDVTLSTALIQAYHTLLMVGRYPLAIMFLNLAPETVDVNVHPTKAEVRFRDADAVFRGVQRAVRRALLAHTAVPELTDQIRWTPPFRQDRTWEVRTQFTDTPETPDSQPSESVLPAHLPGPHIPILRLVGQIAATYLVAEGPDGLYLIDQHAAHERVLFERFIAMRAAQKNNLSGKNSLPAQRLLDPVVITLDPSGARLLEGQLNLLDELGFQVEGFGPNTFLVRSVPVILAGMDVLTGLRVLIEDFEEDEAPLMAEIEARSIARICKRAAVKAGRVLPVEEQRALLADLEACSSPRTCPHGRPTMIHLPVDLLERQFGRKGPR